MADRPNTKVELDQFLDQQFSPLPSEEPTKGTEQPQDDEVDISEYLAGDDDELSQEQPAGLTQPAKLNQHKMRTSLTKNVNRIRTRVSSNSSRAEMYETTQYVLTMNVRMVSNNQQNHNFNIGVF